MFQGKKLLRETRSVSWAVANRRKGAPANCPQAIPASEAPDKKKSWNKKRKRENKRPGNFPVGSTKKRPGSIVQLR
jgi:hypothetical protein